MNPSRKRPTSQSTNKSIGQEKSILSDNGIYLKPIPRLLHPLTRLELSPIFIVPCINKYHESNTKKPGALHINYKSKIPLSHRKNKQKKQYKDTAISFKDS